MNELLKAGSEVQLEFPDINYEKLESKQIAIEVEKVRTAIKRLNEDLNRIMEKNH
jgi:hypothetical protein